MLIENAAFCNLCFDTLNSTKPNEVKKCSCGTLRVSGGLENPHIEGDCTNLSWGLEDAVVNNCVHAIRNIKDKREIVLTVLRTLRRAERIIAEGEPLFIAEYNNEYMFLKDGNYVTCTKEVYHD